MSAALNSYLSIDSSDRCFYPVGGEYLERMDVVTEIFHRILTPLYGSQEKAIQQIRESKDRKCFLLYEGEVPAGVLVFKTVLSNEFSEFGITDSIEIKSLFVDFSAQNSGRGLGSALVDKLQEEVHLLGLRHTGIHVTVSETKQESLAFFRKKGFDIAHKWKDRYLLGVSEYLLFCPSAIQKIQKDVLDFTHRFHGLSIAEAADRIPPELFHTIQNAHYDDIHALKLLADGTFISGSKDNSLRKWNKNGELVKIVADVEPTLRNDRDWITAVEVLNDEYWMSGERSGRVSLWRTDGTYVKDILLELPIPGRHISRPLNTRRVNCLAAGSNPSKPELFVGFPTMFDSFNLIENRTESVTQAHKNDWVYCIRSLTKNQLLVATGCSLHFWNRTSEGWAIGETLLKEGPTKKIKSGAKYVWQRPFISSTTLLKSSPHHLGLSLFDGSVRVMDTETKQNVYFGNEHRGRVWMIEPMTPHLFASSGEDRTIKIWDQRFNNSVHTIKGHAGQVTSILSMDENILIGGTCPEQGLTSKRGAEIKFYDIRRS